MSMRKAFVVGAMLLLAGCGGTAKALVSPSGVATATPLAQSFNLLTHCGIVTTYFAGRTFYLAKLDPTGVSVSGNPASPITSTRCSGLCLS